MELFNIENPFYEKWKPGRPNKKALEKRAKYWELEARESGVTHINASKAFLKNPKAMKLLHQMVENAKQLKFNT